MLENVLIKVRKLFKLKNNCKKDSESFGVNVSDRRHLDLLEEIRYSQIFHDTTLGSSWLLDKSFSPNNGAANYSFLYLIYRVLNEVQPQLVLEMGLGQSTKVTSQYANSFDAKVDVIEHSKEWIEIFSQKLPKSNNFKIHHLDLVNFTYKGVQSDKYGSLDKVILGKKYNFVIIDGPYGFDRKYPRTNVLDMIPNNLASDFVIILDDAERDGEKNTAKLIFDSLDKNKIPYSKVYFEAAKTQLVITSISLSYIGYF